jgi:hypothetical protein
LTRTLERGKGSTIDSGRESHVNPWTDQAAPSDTWIAADQVKQTREDHAPTNVLAPVAVVPVRFADRHGRNAAVPVCIFVRIRRSSVRTFAATALPLLFLNLPKVRIIWKTAAFGR